MGQHWGGVGGVRLLIRLTEPVVRAQALQSTNCLYGIVIHPMYNNNNAKAYALFTGPAVKTSSEENTVGSNGASFWCFTSSLAKTSSLEIKFTPLSCSFTLLKLIHLCLEEKNLSIGCWDWICAGTQQRDTVLKLATLRICLTIACDVC